MGLESIFFADNRATDDLAARSVRSGMVSVAARIVNALIQVASLIVLARLLAPHDFGLVAMVSAILGFAPFLIDLGLSDATVQRATLRPAEASALFWLTTALGATLSLAIVLAAPLIARFYGEPQLELIAIVIAPSVLLTALSLQHRALMRRAMMFREVAFVAVGAELVSTAVTIVLAREGAGYWALVAKPIVTALTALVATVALCRWWPGKPAFDANVRHMLRFGANVTAFTFADFIGRNVDRVGVGYFFGTRPLGFYDKALSVYESSVYLIAGPLHSVATASLSKLRDDPPQFRARYADAIATLTFFSVPAFAVLAVAGQDVVVLLMGDKWLAAGLLLSIVALCGPAHIIERSQGWLHVAAGRADRWARWGLVSSASQVLAVAFGLPFGAEGVAWAYAICIYALFVPSTLYAGRPVGMRLSMLARALGPQYVAGIVAGATAFFLLRELFASAPPGVRIAVALAVCGLVYLVVVLAVLRVRRPVYIACTVARDLLPSRFRGFLIPVVRWSGERNG